MMYPELERRASLYLQRLSATIENRLGAGTDGDVWQTTRDTAVKVFFKETNFELELECYLRLMREWRDQQQELWGEHFPTIQSILRKLQALGIFYADPKPGNIMPENWDPEL